MFANCAKMQNSDCSKVMHLMNVTIVQCSLFNVHYKKVWKEFFLGYCLLLVLRLC